MRDVSKVCTFQGGDYKVIYRCEDDPRKQQIVHITQVAHIGKPEWHLDLWNMKVDSWEDADNLISQISSFINVIKAGEV